MFFWYWWLVKKPATPFSVRSPIQSRVTTIMKRSYIYIAMFSCKLVCAICSLTSHLAWIEEIQDMSLLKAIQFLKQNFFLFQEMKDSSLIFIKFQNLFKLMTWTDFCCPQMQLWWCMIYWRVVLSQNWLSTYEKMF